MSPQNSLVVLTPEQVHDIVGRAVRDAIGDRAANDSDWLDMTAVAAMLKVKRDTVRKLVGRDGLPHYRAGRTYTFRRSEIVEWLEERAEKPRARTSHHAATIRLANGGRKEHARRG